ncbi:aminotransferase class I/II-fold pyridoxal phosphate-dependent enzyme [Pedobacter sp. P351]|uniref:pyridoxal phosphate-dependent aminotransferase n=1 Tax=Pedobacter superstes TaxID=3133441 RepID=UPI00309C2FAA
MLQGHGDDGYRYQYQIKADFSTNVWHGGEPENLKTHLFRNWECVNRYPEVIAEKLSEKIAAQYLLDTDNVLVNNGSTESIYLIAQAWQNSRTAIAVPSFAEYEDACAMYGHNLTFVNWDELHAELKINADLFFICNPNNPTGSVFTELETLLQNNPECTIIVDEAFIDFSLSVSSVIHLIKKYANLVVLHSLTKAFAIPGLRLGYIAAHADLIARLKRFKFPWSVNAMALEAGHFIFDNFASIQIPVQQLLNDKKDFVLALADAPISVFESHTHFFLAESNRGRAADLKNFLLSQFGLLIRDAANFRGLKETHFRIATLSPDKNRLLIKALEAWKNH